MLKGPLTLMPTAAKILGAAVFLVAEYKIFQAFFTKKEHDDFVSKWRSKAEEAKGALNGIEEGAVLTLEDQWNIHKITQGMVHALYYKGFIDHRVKWATYNKLSFDTEVTKDEAATIKAFYDGLERLCTSIDKGSPIPPYNDANNSAKNITGLTALLLSGYALINYFPPKEVDLSGDNHSNEEGE